MRRSDPSNLSDNLKLRPGAWVRERARDYSQDPWDNNAEI
jgi:hypothetical protein